MHTANLHEQVMAAERERASRDRDELARQMMQKQDVLAEKEKRAQELMMAAKAAEHVVLARLLNMIMSSR